MVYKAYKFRKTPARLIPILGGDTITWGETTAPDNSLTPTLPNMGYSLVLDEQFDAAATSRWNVYNNSTYGAPMRIQKYMAANTQFGPGASVGATNGTSLRQVVRRDNPDSTHEFSAGMVDSKNAGKFYPLYNRTVFRLKVPHGQGLWPATWLTSKAGGANIAEWDMLEYFHAYEPGRNRSTFHGMNGQGVHINNLFTTPRPVPFFEAPTYTPGWHVIDSEILPVTSAAGTAVGDLTKPSQNVLFRIRIDDKLVYSYVHTDALYWTTNGSDSVNTFWNIYIQGCQIQGPGIGLPDDPLGYSAYDGRCTIGGTAPNACSLTANGYNVQRAGAAGSIATLGGPAVTYEHDYIKIYQAVPS